MSEKWKHVVVTNFTQNLSRQSTNNLFDEMSEKSLNSMIICFSPNAEEEAPLGTDAELDSVTDEYVVIHCGIGYGDYGHCKIEVKRNSFAQFYRIYFEVKTEEVEQVQKYLLDTYGIETKVEDGGYYA
jgi:hypothetical protein